MKRPSITVAFAAERLGVSEARVRFLVRAGRISAARIGARMWLIDWRSLESYQAGKVGRPARRVDAPMA